MIVISAQYQNIYVDGSVEEANHNIKATIDGQDMTIPIDPANRHYQAILEWVAEGNTIADAE